MTTGLLFHNNSNLLPRDGEVYYYGPIFDTNTAQDYYHTLLEEVEWKNDEAYIFGKHIVTKRKIAWYGNQNYLYRYSNTSKIALPWSDTLLELKNKVEKISGQSYNSCLLNLYHNGQETMGWHSDGEEALKKNAAIASLSFGAERKFSFKHKTTKDTISLILQRGGLLIMQGSTQENWLHRLPPSKKVQTPRINLTFRTIENQQ